MAKVPSLVLIVSASLGVIFAPARADGCSCIMPGPACENYWKVEHVFDGTVLAISDTSHMEAVAPGREYRIPRKVVTFKVHRAYKNVAQSEVEVVTGMGGGDCGYDFKPGVRYLVFASRRSPIDGRIEANICSATQPYDERSTATAWLEGLARPSTGGTIYGSIVRQDQNYQFGPDSPRQPLEGIVILLEGAEGQRQTTSSNGEYRFTGLAPGEYAIRPQLPSGLWRPERPIEASLPDARACAARDIYTAIDGRISGLLVHHDGSPARPVMVEAAPADADLDGRRLMTQRARVDENGRFEFERLPPGEYVVGVNLRDVATSGALYPRTLLPGSAPDVPAVVPLGPGERIDVGTLTLPAPAVVRRIKGLVIGVDGKPAANVNVIAEERSRPGPRPVGAYLSTKTGAFDLPVRSDGRYVVTASLREGPRVLARAETGILSVTNSDIEDLRLKLKPVPPP